MKQKCIIGVLLSFIFCALCVGSLSSCNVTRVVTNESKYYQKGDTAVTIQTKITETYDASKKPGF